MNREKIADAVAHARAAVDILRAAIRAERDATVRHPLMDARDCLSGALVELEHAREIMRAEVLVSSEVRS